MFLPALPKSLLHQLVQLEHFFLEILLGVLRKQVSYCSFDEGHSVFVRECRGVIVERLDKTLEIELFVGYVGFEDLVTKFGGYLVVRFFLR